MSAIFVSVPHGTSAGNMLRAGGLLDRLHEFDPSLQIVLLSPLIHDAAFVREFERQGVRLLDLPAHKPSQLEARLLTLVQAAYLSRGRTESVRIRMLEARANGIIRWVRLKGLLGRPLSAPFGGDPYALSDRLVSHPAFDALFDQYRPVLVVCANPGLVFAEVPLMRTARRRRVPCMVIDASWDNFTNKLLPVRHVDRLVVWNDIIKEQAVTIHGYDPSAIRVAGAPQFDPHFRPQSRSTRDEFFRRVGADPSRKLIAVTTTPRSLYRHHDHVLRELHAAMTRGVLKNVQVLVRLHPRDEVEAYRELEGIPHIIIEKPFRSSVAVADGLAIDVMPEHQRHLGDTLYHADVVVNVASTIAIEACIFDTPIVNICFDGPQPERYERSAMRYYSFTHYVNVTNRHAVRVTTSPAEMVEWIGCYLENPSLDAEGRKQVVLDQCQFTDGRSASRVVACVIEELDGLKGKNHYEMSHVSTRPSRRLAPPSLDDRSGRPEQGRRAEAGQGNTVPSEAKPHARWSEAEPR